ncbi:hypothetical protein ACTXT7_016662 [Hymenolepis weldensis]
MAPEQLSQDFDFSRFGGPKQSFSYNSGVVLWHLEHVTMEKWDSIWKPAYKIGLEKFNYLPAAEQSLMTVAIMYNPEIFYPLSCVWNYQLYDGVHLDHCSSTWTTSPRPDIPEPLVVHINRGNKLETTFSLNQPKHLATNLQELRERYVVARSWYNVLSGYALGHATIERPQFSFLPAMERLHPGGRLLSHQKLCQIIPRDTYFACNISTPLSFNTDHRIHPLFVSKDHKLLTSNAKEITLATYLSIADVSKLTALASQWKGYISVTVYGTDKEVLSLLSFIEKAEAIKERNNIFIHYVYENKTFPESTTLHNTAVTYAPTYGVLVIPNNDVALSSLEKIIGKDKTSSIKNAKVDFKKNIQGLVISTSHSLLPREMDNVDRLTQLQALLANYI